ncbi:MAG: SDR family oxidoreductase [Defluviicoccus sp.]|nr:SDR family oxidoreductase [Defluviicoccus sp.]MDE0384030.1 SDR family oxidoreductase [Defluviicoccus sp.]
MAIGLEGKNVVVTGAARGLGRAYAEACCAAGARVAVADILEEEGRATVDALKEAGREAIFVPVDLAEPGSVDAMGDRIGAAWGRIDGLVNNAALATGLGGKRIQNIDVEVWDRVMAVNARGVWLATRACLPWLRESENGKIVNISSDTALFGSDFILHYVASKGAVISMTRAMARELGEDNIAVNAIAPGMTRVEATAGVPEERHQRYVQGRFIKRDQHPEDLVGTVVYLLSDAANFVTGQLLAVNGGYVLN